MTQLLCCLVRKTNIHIHTHWHAERPTHTHTLTKSQTFYDNVKSLFYSQCISNYKSFDGITVCQQKSSVLDCFGFVVFFFIFIFIKLAPESFQFLIFKNSQVILLVSTTIWKKNSMKKILLFLQSIARNKPQLFVIFDWQLHMILQMQEAQIHYIWYTKGKCDWQNNQTKNLKKP